MNTPKASTLRLGAAVALLPLLLVACDRGPSPLAVDGTRVSLSGTFPVPLPAPGDNQADVEEYELCKVGSSADFSYTIGWSRNGTTTDSTTTKTIHLNDGECKVIFYTPFNVLRGFITVTETSAQSGFHLDHVEVTTVTGPASARVYSTRTETGPSVTDTTSAGVGTLKGQLVRFFNAPNPSGQIGDFVWHDLNGNGIQDLGEPGIAGVTVTLSGAASGTTTTDANGGYLFTGLSAGSYTVTVGTPAGYNASPSNQGGDPAKDSNGSPASVTLATNSSSDLTIDFGFVAIPSTNVTLCKVGSAADFTVTVSAVDRPFSLGNMECRVVHVHAGGSAPDNVLITETVPTGYVLDSIRVQGGAKYTGTTNVTVTSSDAGDITVTFYNRLIPPPPSGGQGCTPGYWKQSQHFDSWPTQYTPGQAFSSVFANAFPGKTLLQVLGLGGGGLNALGRHTVAALLNAGKSSVSYDLATAQVISAFNAAYASGNYEAQKNIFANFNEQGCPLN